MDSNNIHHVQAIFFTKQAEFSIPDTLFSIPSTVTSKELNEIIHGVLNQGTAVDGELEFDFLLQGEFLRTSLESHLEEKDISSETVIEIEYVKREAAPRPETSLAHDDWVSCVRGSSNLILCGCYDNTIRLWTLNGQCLTTIPGHTAPVKCVSWLSDSDSTEGSRMFVSGSHDQTLFIWNWKSSSKEVDCLYACRGHAGSVDCVAVNVDGQRLVSGSWDKMIKLWSTVGGQQDHAEEADGEDDDSHKSKKLKVSGHKVETRTPLLTTTGHKEGISSLAWTSESNVCSVSWDHTIRLWDMSSGTETQVLEGPKAFFDVAHSPLNGLILSASADRHVRIHDMRAKEMKGSYTSHTGWVSSVDWSKTNEHLFISGSHDKLMKLWDTRSPKTPLYNLIGQEDKILAVDWSIPHLMLSGGADNQLKIFNYNKT